MFSVVFTLKTVISYIFYLSYKIGQFIVTTVHLLWSKNIDFLSKLYTLLSVIIEDFTIFLKDVIDSVNNILTSLSELCDKLTTSTYGALQALGYVLQLIGTSIQAAYNTGISGVTVILNCIKNMFVLLKRIILMLGDGFWFIIVFVPKSFISLCISLISYCHFLFLHLFDYLLSYAKFVVCKIVESLYDCYYFVTDVPVESLIGLIIALCFLYIFMQFYTVLYQYIHEKVYSFLNGVKRKYNRLKRKLMRFLMKKNREPTSEIQFSPSSIKTANETSCIICQDHPKCILVLPCKHLCLCLECTPRLMRYTGRCPICRKGINSTMKIFT